MDQFGMHKTTHNKRRPTNSYIRGGYCQDQSTKKKTELRCSLQSFGKQWVQRLHFYFFKSLDIEKAKKKKYYMYYMVMKVGL
uniref:Uncharacterized protein n=1 Tax=Megaselia scalaris TaxID=36166 RepID=T1GXI7_MEGSC